MKDASLNKDFLKFKDYYSEKIIRTLEKVNRDLILDVIELIERAILTKKNTIYIFGNGGSHAIARHLGINLSNNLKATTYSVRVNYGIDFHMSQIHSGSGKYENIFVETLETEKADNDDLVILISGSGDSDNILQAADYCIEHGIPTISFSGFNGGKIASKKLTKNIIAAVADQQICEDVIELLLHITFNGLIRKLNKEEFEIEDLYKDMIYHTNNLFKNVEAKFLGEVSKSISNAFLKNKKVFVLGPEGQGLSVSAEHIAHNLNWDVVFQIKTPPKRNIFSSPTYTDFSGIGNDRLIPGVAIVQQLDKAEKGDVVLFFIYDLDNLSVQLALEKALAHNTNIFVVFGKGETNHSFNHCNIKSSDKIFSGDITQALGHIIARLVRYRLKVDLKKIDGEIDIFSFLVNGDMAQRRLLDEPNLYG